MDPDESYLIGNSVNLPSGQSTRPADSTKDKCSSE